MNKTRLDSLDIFRGWAILFMIIYHFGYDLNLFGYISVNPNNNIWWIIPRYIIIFIFLLSMGMSLKLAHKDSINWKKVAKRTAILSVVSIIITISTYISFPSSWVYFGIIHFILISSLIGLIFVAYPRLSIFAIAFISIGSTLGWLKLHYIYVFLKAPLHLPRYTQDFVPFFPWFGVVLLGIVIVSYGWHEKLFTNRLLDISRYGRGVLAFMGRNALVIYLVHLPIIFGVFMLSR